MPIVLFTQKKPAQNPFIRLRASHYLPIPVIKVLPYDVAKAAELVTVRTPVEWTEAQTLPEAVDEEGGLGVLVPLGSMTCHRG